MKNLKEVYENSYVSIESYNAEDNKPFKFSISVRVINLDSACGQPGFLISVDAAKLPKYLTAKNRKSVAESIGVNIKDISVNEVAEYGLCAPLDNYTVLTGNEVENKLSEIDNQIPIYGMMCGFYFDKQANQIGNTGWDFLNGNIG